jgi:hypothetical protein
MERIKFIFFSGLLFTSCNVFSQSPGGIPKHTYWLKGNFSSDISMQGSLNYNPAMVLDNRKISLMLPGKIESLGRSTIFTVYQNTTPEEERPVWEMMGEFGDLSLSTFQVASNTGKTKLVFTKKDPTVFKPESYKQLYPETFINTYLSYKGTSASPENTDKKDASIHFGNLNSTVKDRSSHGLISEFILYEKILNEVEIAKVETYLALKYGITLQKNYLNALGETVWNWKVDSLFSNNIAGIGRDDQSMLYQKQSTSCNTSGQLVIGSNKIAESNSHNTGKINNRNYLIWGDNAKNLTLEHNSDASSCEYILSEKKWLMKTSGKSSSKISTELKININSLLPGYSRKENFYLIIDRSGSGDFAKGNCEYFIPDNISADGIACFSNLYWDTDASGKDLFAFGIKPMFSSGALVNGKSIRNSDAASHISFRLYPNPVTDGQYNIAVSLNKKSDIQIEVYDLNQHLLDTKKGSGQASYLFTRFINAPSGPYFVRLITPETEVYRIMILQ